MRTGEVALSTKGIGVFLLSVDVLTLGTDRGRRKCGGCRCVGVIQCGLAAGDAQRLCTAVLCECTAVGGRFSGKRVVGDRTSRFIDGLLGGLGVRGDLLGRQVSYYST